MRHGGHRVTRGERYIIGAFLLLEDRVEHVRRMKNRGSKMRSAGDLAGAVKRFEWALEINPSLRGVGLPRRAARGGSPGRDTQHTSHIRSLLWFNSPYCSIRRI